MVKSLWEYCMVQVQRSLLFSVMAYIPRRFQFYYLLHWNFLLNLLFPFSKSHVLILVNDTVKTKSHIFYWEKIFFIEGNVQENIATWLWTYIFFCWEIVSRTFSYLGTHPHGEPGGGIGERGNQCLPLWLCREWVSSLQSKENWGISKLFNGSSGYEAILTRSYRSLVSKRALRICLFTAL